MTDLAVERADSYAVLTLDRAAKKNALSVALRNEISNTLDKLAADEAIKAVVITGAGDVFSAGFDLKEFPRALEDEAFATELWASSDRYHHAVLRFPVPTIAAVNGPALAGGFDLALLCDIRIASTRAAFAHPEYTFGDVVYGPLHDLAGGAVARDLTFTGRVVDADEALAMRLVSQVVEPGELMAATLAVVARIVQAPREILMRTKTKALARARTDPATGTLDL